MKINKRVVLFLGKDLVRVRVTFLPNYPLVLSLLKYRGIRAFLNLKIRNPNRESPLNNSIYIYIYILAEAERKWVPTIKEALTNRIVDK